MNSSSWSDKNILFGYIPTQSPIKSLHPGNPKSGFQGKVFCIGISKTGTSSVAKALSQMGYESLIWQKSDPMQMKLSSSRYSALHYWYKNYNLPIHLGVDDISWLFHHPTLLESVKYVTSRASNFGDYPWLLLYRIFNEWYPDSKFILTVRDSSWEVVNSALKQVARNLKTSKIFRFEELLKKSAYRLPMIDYIMNVARSYELQSENVIRYFQSFSNSENKLLILNLKKDGLEACDKLSTFLESDMKLTVFPMRNTAPAEQAPILLPLDFELDWRNHRFCDRLQRRFDLIHSYDPASTNEAKFIAQLKNMYGPLKPEFFSYPEFQG